MHTKYSDGVNTRIVRDGDSMNSIQTVYIHMYADVLCVGVGVGVGGCAVTCRRFGESEFAR
jgi:hypothetical protein